MRGSRSVSVISLGLLFASALAVPAAADPVLEIAGPKVGVYLIGQVPTPGGTHFDKLVVSFTTTVPLEDIS